MLLFTKLYVSIFIRETYREIVMKTRLQLDRPMSSALNTARHRGDGGGGGIMRRKKYNYY